MLTIRPYRPADQPSVLELHDLGLDQVGTHLGPGSWDDDLANIVGAYLEAGGDFLVGVLDDRVVAMGAIRRLSELEGEIKRMRVHPAHQRRGFGQSLLSSLEARARLLGFRRLILDTTLKQDAARALYAKNGYLETRREPWRDTEMVHCGKDLEVR